MAIFGGLYRFFSGNSLSDRKGVQESVPSYSAYDDAPSVGIDGALQISTVWACISLLVENIASLPLVPYLLDRNDNRIVDKESRIYQVLHDKPNGKQTAMAFWMVMLMGLFLRGNAYARKELDSRGETIALWPLSPDQMQVIVNDNDELLYRYQDGYAVKTYTQAQIFHIRGMGSNLVGLSPLDNMRASLGLSIRSQNHLNKTFGKNARRPGMLMTDRVLNPEQRTAAKARFNDIASGNERELYLMEGGFKFEPLGMSPADIQLLETRKFNVQDLARWFGVPSVLVNDTADTTTLGSSVQQIIDGFYKLKLRPMLVLIEQAIEQQVFTPQQRSRRMYAEFNMDALLRSSLADRMDVYAKGAQNGIYKRNECRKWENLAPVDGGEILTAQSNLLPLDKLGSQVNTGGNVPSEPIRQ